MYCWMIKHLWFISVKWKRIKKYCTTENLICMEWISLHHCPVLSAFAHWFIAKPISSDNRQFTRKRLNMNCISDVIMEYCNNNTVRQEGWIYDDTILYRLKILRRFLFDNILALFNSKIALTFRVLF